MNWLDRIKRAPDGLNRAEACMAEVFSAIGEAHRAAMLCTVEQINPFAVDAFTAQDAGLANEVALMDVKVQEQARTFTRMIWRIATVEAIIAIAAQHGATQAERNEWALMQIAALLPDIADGAAP
jgi:hypothetical protein